MALNVHKNTGDMLASHIPDITVILDVTAPDFWLQGEVYDRSMVRDMSLT